MNKNEKLLKKIGFYKKNIDYANRFPSKPNWQVDLLHNFSITEEVVIDMDEKEFKEMLIDLFKHMGDDLEKKVSSIIKEINK